MIQGNLFFANGNHPGCKDHEYYLGDASIVDALELLGDPYEYIRFGMICYLKLSFFRKRKQFRFINSKSVNKLDVDKLFPVFVRKKEYDEFKIGN